jgi:hypothetical protein
MKVTPTIASAIGDLPELDEKSRTLETAEIVALKYTKRRCVGAVVAQ